jgi:hypothetical protein
VCKHADNSCILLHPLQIRLKVFLTFICLILLSILGKGLLDLVPVFVKAPLEFITEMLSPDGVEGVFDVPTNPTTIIGGVSIRVTASHVSFLCNSATDHKESKGPPSRSRMKKSY